MASLGKIDRIFSSHSLIRRNPELVRKMALQVLGYKDVVSFMAANRNRVASVTFFAGTGSRWIDSVRRAQRAGQAKDIDLTKPRCLAEIGDPKMAVGTYNLWAISGIGLPFIVYRTHLPEIAKMAQDAGVENAKYILQEIPPGLLSPLGHGDAIMQVLPYLPASVKFVITNFGGDVNSRKTIITSLMALAALQKLQSVDAPLGIMPVAQMKDPAYPIETTDWGLPQSFGHKKLKKSHKKYSLGLTNVGIRLYDVEGLRMAQTEMFKYFDPKTGYSIPDNGTNEFALDNIDLYLAQLSRMRLLCIATRWEITSSLKSWERVNDFLAAQKKLQALDMI